MPHPNHAPTNKLYTSEMDFDEDQIEAFANWYAFRHGPDLYQAGAQICTSYRSVTGTMTIMDLYEIKSCDFFATPEYRNIKHYDPYVAEILRTRGRLGSQAKAQNVYEQLLVEPAPVSTRPLLNADWIRVERFDSGELAPQALFDYLRSAEAERILQAGAKRVRLGKRIKGAPAHQSDFPPYMLLSEWPDRPAMDDIGGRLLARFGTAISRQSHFLGYRLYPWVDRQEVVPR